MALSKGVDKSLDPLIAPYVRLLNEHGIETVESCQMTDGHMDGLPGDGLPWIDFRGDAGAGYRAVGVALEFGLPVVRLIREWSVLDHALDGPVWRIKFKPFSNGHCQ